ncbi:MAG: CoA transferase, partial [Slackia sp.]|nr:CoA transferase [Slackia sp.]
VVKEFPDLVEEEHMKLRENWLEWEMEDGGTFKGLNVFPKFQQTPGQVWRPLPSLGADTADVLAKIGYTPEQIADLEAAGIVKTA